MNMVIACQMCEHYAQLNDKLGLCKLRLKNNDVFDENAPGWCPDREMTINPFS